MCVFDGCLDDGFSHVFELLELDGMWLCLDLKFDEKNGYDGGNFVEIFWAENGNGTLRFMIVIC